MVLGVGASAPTPKTTANPEEPTNDHQVIRPDPSLDMNFLRRLFFQIFYLRKPPWDTGVSPPELMAYIQDNPPGRALDLGCGTGTNAITMAQHGWDVVGVDFIPRAIKKARKKAGQAQLSIDFRVEDVTRLEGVSGPFDLILDIGCFHSLPDQGKTTYLQNLERLLAPSGTFLMYAYFHLPDEPPNSLAGGLDEADLRQLGAHLRLVRRQDGSERGRRPSAWIWYQR